MEPPGTETQALKAFFNDDLDNDSVCGTEDSEDASKRTSDSCKRATGTFSMIAETQSPVKPLEESPSIPPEEAPPMSEGCSEKQRAEKPVSELGLNGAKDPAQEQCALSDGQGGNAAAAGCVVQSVVGDGQGQPLATAQALTHSATPDNSMITPTIASVSAAKLDGGTSSSLRASTGEQGRVDNSAKPLACAEPQSDAATLHTQIEAQVHLLTEPSAVAKLSEHASIPDTQVDLCDPKLLDTMQCRDAAASLQADTQVEAPVEAVKGNAGEPADGPAGNHAGPLAAKDCPSAYKGASPDAGSDVVLSPGDAVTPDLRAFATGSNPPSTTGTIVPESVRPGTAMPDGTQHTLLLPEEPALHFPHESGSERGPRASCGSVIANEKSPGATSVPVGMSAVVDAPSSHAARVAEPAAQLNDVQEEAAAECATPEGLNAAGISQLPEDCRKDAGLPEVVDKTGDTGVPDTTSPADDATERCREDLDAAKNDSERPDSAVLNTEDPVGDVERDVDVAGDTAPNCGADADPETSVGVAKGSRDEVMKDLSQDGPRQSISANGMAANDIEPAADIHIQDAEEEHGAASAAAPSEPQSSPPNLDDSQMMLMMTQPADTVDMMALNGGIFDLAKQLCGDLVSTTPTARPKASAEKSGLAVASKGPSTQNLSAEKNAAASSENPTAHTGLMVDRLFRADDKQEAPDERVKQQLVPSDAGEDSDNPHRPVRNKRQRPQRLRDTPTPQKPRRGSSQVEAKPAAENREEPSAQPTGLQEEAEPDPACIPITDTLESLEQKLSTGAPEPRPERASHKRTASQAEQAAQDGQQARDEDMEPAQTAEVQKESAPRTKRRKKEQKGAAMPPKPKPKESVKQARKGPARKTARTAPKKEEKAEPQAAPAATPAPSRPGRRRRTPVSVATPERDSPVPGTPRRRSSVRRPIADHLMSPTRDRAVALPRKLAIKAKSAGLQIREHRAGEKVADFTHFVADELVLSLHTLVALAAGRPIVTTAWLHQSIDGGAALPVGSLLLEDLQAEKRHKFIMKSSYDAARSRKLLHGCVCCVSDSLIKAESDDGDGLKLVIKAALGIDGQFLEGSDALTGYISAQSSDDSKRVLLLVEAGADKRSLRRVLPKGVQVWTRPQFVQAIVQQTFSHQHAFLQT